MVRGADVVGFLHADHGRSSRRVDEFDRDLLLVFADGLGQINERMVLTERLRTQRDHVREIMASAVQTMNDLCDAGIDLGRYPEADAPSARGSVSLPPNAVPAVNGVTAREAEVLELIVAGATNSAIAKALVITEDTVKSHVKHILRKLGAANRSQAIAIALAMDG
jgi:DNA-binding NarL/FixJ family response regulator